MSQSSIELIVLFDDRPIGAVDISNITALFGIFEANQHQHLMRLRFPKRFPVHELHETCDSVTFYFMTKDSKQ